MGIGHLQVHKLQYYYLTSTEQLKAFFISTSTSLILPLFTEMCKMLLTASSICTLGIMKNS